MALCQIFGLFFKQSPVLNLRKKKKLNPVLVRRRQVGQLGDRFAGRVALCVRYASLWFGLSIAICNVLRDQPRLAIKDD